MGVPIGLPNPKALLNHALHHLGIGGGQKPQPNAVDNVATRRLITMLTLGAINASHPQQGKEYWKDTLKEMDPRTPEGLIALGATIFGPRLDAEAALSPDELGPINPKTGLRVPLPKVSMKSAHTGNPHRDMILDHSNVLQKALQLRREAAMPGLTGYGAHIQERAINPDLLESAHQYAETNDFLHSAGDHSRPSMAVAQGAPLTPRQLVLLRLAGHQV